MKKLLAAAFGAAFALGTAFANSTMDVLTGGAELEISGAEGSYTASFDADGTYTTSVGTEGTWELDGEELYRVQKESNLMRFLDDFFFYRQTKLAHCTFDNHIYIDETIQHPQSRTTFLFWSFWEKDLETLSGKDGTRRRQQAELAEQVSANLNRFASYLGRIALTQLGGKKPPKFVFLKSEREVFLENARKKFAKEFPVLIRKQILQQKEEFAPMFRSREDIQEYIDMNLPLYLDECLKHHGKLFSNHTVLGQLKNKHGSLEVYLQKLAGKKVAPRKVRLSPSEKAERKFQKNLRDFNAKWDGQL